MPYSNGVQTRLTNEGNNRHLIITSCPTIMIICHKKNLQITFFSDEKKNFI